MVKNFSNTVDVTKLGIPKIEAEIADLSSKVLPDVTSEDAGKVLVVNDSGKWIPGEASGGASDFIIPASFNVNNYRCTLSSGTWADIIDSAYQAYQNGSNVYVDVVFSNTPYLLLCYFPTSTSIRFSIPVYLETSTKRVFNLKFVVGSTTGSYVAGTPDTILYTIPSYSSSDDGKLLQVVSGSATWVDLDGNNDQF